MVKTKIRDGLCLHDKHLDINIPFGMLPFDIQLGEELYCAVKHYQKRGIRTDNRAHIFITKNVANSINEAIVKNDFEDIDDKELKTHKQYILAINGLKQKEENKIKTIAKINEKNKKLKEQITNQIKVIKKLKKEIGD